MSDTKMGATEIRQTIKEQISASTPTVIGRVIDKLVDEEITKRSNCLIDALNKKDQLKADFDKIKPDQESYNDAGEVASTSWSKAKIAEKNKARKELDEFTAILDKALLDGDFEKLLQKMSKG